MASNGTLCMWPYLKGKAGSSAVTRVPAGGGFKHVGIVGMAVATRSILDRTVCS